MLPDPAIMAIAFAIFPACHAAAGRHPVLSPRPRNKCGVTVAGGWGRLWESGWRLWGCKLTINSLHAAADASEDFIADCAALLGYVIHCLFAVYEFGGAVCVYLRFRDG